MTEDDLLVAITDALTLTGWRWSHVRRSDRALSMGYPGLPDVLAIRGKRVLAWELKSARGRVTDPQRLWLEVWERVGADARVIRPIDLDAVLELIR